MRLSVKLALITFIIFAVSTVSVSYIVYFSTRAALQDAISEQYQTDLKKEMIIIDRTLNERFGDIQAFAIHTEFAQLFTNQKNTPDILDKTRRRLGLLKVLYGSWSDISLISRDGKRILSTNPLLEGKNIGRESDEDARIYSRVFKGDVVVTDVFKEDITGLQIVAFLAPVRSDDGRVVGVIDGYFSWNVILEILQEHEETTTYLTNKNGLIIATSREGDRKSLFTKNYQNTSILNAASHQHSGVAVIPDSESSDKLFAVYTYEKGYLDYTGSHWLLISQLPERVAFAPAQETAVKTMLLLIGIISLTMVIIIVFMLLQVTRPIRTLTSAVTAISSGNLDKRIVTTSRDELGILASAFNVMADKLQATYQQLQGTNVNLEDEVAKRTTELQQKLEELERFQKLTVGREVKMMELKKRIEELEKSKAA